MMSENHPIHYRMGHVRGRLSAKQAKKVYPEKLGSAEVEEDVLPYMVQYWGVFEDEFTASLRNYNLDASDPAFKAMRNGWSNGFLDEIFPLRELV